MSSPTATAPIPDTPEPETPEPEAAPAAATRIDPMDGLAQWFAMGGMATIGMTAIRVAGWALSDYLFFACGGVITLRLLAGAREGIAPPAARKASPTILIGLLVMTVGALLATMLRSVDPAGSALQLVRVWYIIVIWFWIVRSVATSPRTLQRLLLAAIIGGVAHAFVGIYQEISGSNQVYPNTGRSAGLSDHFGDLASSLGLLIPILLVWPSHRSQRRGADFCRVAAIIILLAGLGTTGSTTALGATIVGSLVTFVAPTVLQTRSRKKRPSLLPLAAAGLVLLSLFLGLVDFPVLDRLYELRTGGNYVTSSATSRVDMADLALNSAVRSPLVGVGLDDASANVRGPTEAVTHVHSFYLRQLYEAGILGLLGLLLVLGVIGRQVLRLIAYTRGTTISWMATGFLGSYVMVLLHSSFGPILFARHIWLPMALIGALWGLATAGPPPTKLAPRSRQAEVGS